MEERTRILLVENDQADQATFKRFIEREALPYDYVIAGSVSEARKALADAQFDAALIDYLLGDGTAFDLFDVVRDIPIIVITRDGDEEIAIEAMRAGAFDYMVKDPEDNYLKTLPVTVENVIHRKRAEEKLRQYQERLEELVEERTVELTKANEQLLSEIAERKQAEEALRESEEYARNVIDSSLDMIVTGGMDRRIVEFNKAAQENFGYTREEIVGKPVNMLYADQQSVSAIQEAITKEGRCVQEILNRRKDGTIFPSFLSASVMRNAHGEMVGVMGISRDITERKRTEEALRESEEYARNVIDSSLDMIVTVGMDRRIVEFNKAAQESFGYTREEIVGKPVTVLYADQQNISAIQEAINKEGKCVQEILNRRKDGTVFPSFLSASVMRNARGETVGVMGISRDITERKRMEEQLRQHERLAAVGQLAGGIAHDFNNILAAIILCTQMSLGKRNLPPDVTQFLETIHTESRRAAKLVQQILDFGRRSMMAIRPVNLVSFTEEALDILRRMLPDNIHLTLDAQGAGAEEYAAADRGRSALTVEADPTRIQQALMNLALNARDAMPEGGELRVSLSRVKLEAGEEPPVAEMGPGDWVCLAVSDTGTGISEETQTHLFEPFFTTKPVGEGTGLGLAQVYGIVKQHEGYIDVETALGAGTTFRIYLPAHGEGVEEVEAKKNSTSPRGKRETILVVEDAERLRKAMREVLESLGYRVLTAANGHDALEIYRSAEEKASLVITDLVMPGMGGKQLLQELRQEDPDLKALAITGYVVEAGLQELEEIGFLGVVSKPFDVDHLAKEIRRVLDADASATTTPPDIRSSWRRRL